jgi:adenylylsulfate kinase
MIGQAATMDSNTRSIAKAVSYRVFGSITTALIVLFFTGDWRSSAGAGLADSVFKIVLYFLHERLWNYIGFGRQRPPEYEI